jgi:hypothetical protein
MSWNRYSGPIFCLLVLLSAQPATISAIDLSPLELTSPLGEEGPKMARYSDRVLTLGIEIDRGGARLISYTVKERPFTRALTLDEPRSYRAGHPVQAEIVLRGPQGAEFTARIDVGHLCFSHGPDAEPHIEGDTILMHRDSFLVELPEVAGFDHVEIAYYEQSRGQAVRRPLATEKLDRARFTPAGSAHDYLDLAIANPADAGPTAVVTASTAYWPENFADPDIYRVYGDEAEGDSRINVVIVPDGYAYGSKATMQAHADSLVQYFRQKTPYAEHDNFVNYTLVYAYSRDDGTDQCDCDIVLDTAMGTRFPDAGDACGGSGNRCLYYGGGCDTSGTTNIVAAELRAPYHDETIVMVNTPRYGGCGGARAVYSAGVSSATEVAVHELGHSLGGLADEYGGNPSCGTWAGEINTSLDATRGAWLEWIRDIGAPREGGQYYDQCIYRPQANCEMRSLNQPFCAVCNQRWSLVYFGHPRVNPTAPIASATPASPVPVWLEVPEQFAVCTRLATGAAVTDSIEWKVQGPDDPEPLSVATGVTTYAHTFTTPGQHTLSCEVVADTNFVKPIKYGANVDEAVWTVDAIELPVPPEVSPPGSPEALLFSGQASMVWEDAATAGALSYNLYRGPLSGLGGGDYGACSQPGLSTNGSDDAEIPPAAVGWFYLVAGANPVAEGPLGESSGNDPRLSSSPCD